MIGFLIKKNFYDLWDNLFKVALLNLGFIISATAPLFGPSLAANIPEVGIAVLLIGLIWCFVYLSAASLCLKSVSDYGSFGFKDFFSNLKTGLPFGIIAGVMAFVLFMIIVEVIPSYLLMESIFGLLLAAMVFWTLMVGVLSFQFFFAVRARLDTRPLKVIKKCFIVFFDNSIFSCFMLIAGLFMVIISGFTAFLFPGPAGILLFIDQGLRLRIMKYDWLEENPDANRKKIPWDALLIEEREKTGTRTFKNFLFPWKD